MFCCEKVVVEFLLRNILQLGVLGTGRILVLSFEDTTECIVIVSFLQIINKITSD